MRRQGVRPHICPICQVVIWGQSNRFRIHLKLHRKFQSQSRKRKDLGLKVHRASRACKSIPNKKLVEVSETVVKEAPKPTTRPQRVKTTRKPKAEENVRKSYKCKQVSKASKGPPKARKDKAQGASDDVVSIPIPPDPGSLYLCAKCTVGFSDVMALVAHVAICTGTPKATPVVEPKSSRPTRQKKSSKKLAKSDEGDMSQSKPRRKTVIKTEGSRKRSVKIKEIINKSGRKPRIILRRVPADHESDTEVPVDDGDDDDDWVPEGDGIAQNYNDLDWHPAPKRIRIKKEKVDHICQICGSSFSNEASLKKHSLIHLVGKHHCPFCSHSFKRKDQLKAHIKRDHPDENASIVDVKVKKETKDKNECPICRKTFTHKSALFRHKVLHTGERKYQCEFCRVKFTQGCHLKSHIKKVHMSVGTDEYLCKSCSLPFQDKMDYKTHLALHDEENPYECDVCKARFKIESTLKKHNAMVHLDGKKDDVSFTMCNECGKTFTFPASLKRHKLVHMGVKKHQCSRCNKKFSQKGHMNNHRCPKSPFREIKEMSNLCMVCGKSFSSAAGMKHHELSVHAETRDFKCPTCNKGFATSGHLRVHLSGAHGAGNHLCHQCGKSFSFKSSYLRHQKFHTGAKPYKCRYCDRTFSQSSHCKAHQITHEMMNRIECDFCGKRFKNPRNHKHHMKKNHGADCNTFKCFRCGEEFENKDTLSDHMSEKCHNKGYNTVCKICNKAFPTNSHLVRHMRSHTKERPFKCDICEKSFTQNAHLKNHVMRHSKIKPWQCEICGRSYASRDYLKHHVKKQHEEGPDGTMPPEKRKKRTDCEICGKVYKNRKYLKVHLKKKHSGILLKQLTNPVATTSAEVATTSAKVATSTEEPKKDQPQAQVSVPTVSIASDKLQNLVIYPANDNLNRMQIPIPVEIHTAPPGVALQAQVQIPHTSSGMAVQTQPPPGGYQQPAELQSKEHPPQRKPEEGAAGPNMIAESMRLITVNWW